MTVTIKAVQTVSNVHNCDCRVATVTGFANIADLKRRTSAVAVHLCMPSVRLSLTFVT